MGNRYPLCSEEMVDLLPWVQRTIHPDVRPDDLNPSHYPPPIPEPRVHPAFADEVRKFLGEDQLTEEAEIGKKPDGSPLCVLDRAALIFGQMQEPPGARLRVGLAARVRQRRALLGSEARQCGALRRVPGPR